MDDNYRTLARAHRAEPPKTKGSRFIASGFPFAGEERLTAEIARLRDEFPDANHHCWAWRDGDRFRYSDDGEPSGSAGQPILRQLDGAGVDRTAIVVTRIFGGTKLGVGGLVRAYGGATAACLDRAEIRTVKITRKLGVEFPYEFSNPVQHYLELNELEPVEADYGEKIRFELEVPVASYDVVAERLTSITAGRLTLRRDQR